MNGDSVAHYHIALDLQVYATRSRQSMNKVFYLALLLARTKSEYDYKNFNTLVLVVSRNGNCLLVQ